MLNTYDLHLKLTCQLLICEITCVAHFWTLRCRILGKKPAEIGREKSGQRSVGTLWHVCSTKKYAACMWHGMSSEIE